MNGAKQNISQEEQGTSVHGADVSCWILGFYLGTLIFLVALTILVPAKEPMKGFELKIFYLVFLTIIGLFLYLIHQLYTMEFRISGQELRFKGLAGWKEIPLSHVKSIEKTAIPFGFRLFGASFLGGKYYLPGIGRADVAMTNFSDGVLLKTTRDKNYVITPQNPFEFIDSIKARLKK